MPCPCRAVSWPLEVVFRKALVGARHEHGMARVNQTRSHCVNKMEETEFKPLAARQGMGTAWARHAMCELAFKRSWLPRLMN
jgi:hypothetical protein